MIDAVGVRIDRYVLGDAQAIPLDTRYEIIGGGPGWSMVTMQGFYARSQLRQNGITAYVTYGGEQEGRHKYSLGKLSLADPFPIEELYDYLNHLEGIDPATAPHWGGGDVWAGRQGQPGVRLRRRSLKPLSMPSSRDVTV